MIIRIVINMKPVAKGRPRFSGGHAYTPKKTRDATEEMQWLMRQEWKDEILTSPLKVDFRFYMPFPSKFRKAEREAMLGEPHAVVPDLDNLIKLVKDAGNHIIWKDDSQIWAYGKCFKVYSKVPRIEIYVSNDRNE